MNKVGFLILFFIFTGCSSVKVYNRKDSFFGGFIDIEADREDVWIGCSDIDPKEKKSIMNFYLLENDTVHEFLFRRISDVEWCSRLEKEYRTLAEGVRKVRLVGITPRKEKNRLTTDSIPEKFKKPKFMMTWIFIRLHTRKGCKAYFEEGCQPENYWGGVNPLK